VKGGIIVEGGASAEVRAASEIETRNNRKARGAIEMGYLILIIK
jgi:hypothetical protein